MKLFIAPRAPHPRRVQMFIAEKGITDIEEVPVDINAGAHRTDEFRRLSPHARVPVLQLDDGRGLSETRAICAYLEGLYPEPNLMGRDNTERAFIEMADRQAEWYWMSTIAQAVRHTHPGLAPLEKPQFPEYGQVQAQRVRDNARRFDELLATQPYWAGDRFTIADITAFCSIEFARGLLKFRAGDEGFTHLQAWRDRVAERPSAKL
jgi:glutathione S-transferase